LSGLVRLTHPFPSVLDGIVVLAVALVAGASPTSALALGVAMTALQVAIGALNDLVDAPADLGRKPRKPIPSGLVSPRVAMATAAVGALAGTLLAVWAAPPGATVAMAAIVGLVLAIGVAYDLWAKGTPWSWLPFAVGIPLLPVFGWFGAAGTLPPWFLALVPTAAVAGAALAIANARADLERDRAAGIGSVAVHLGEPWSWRAHAVLWLIVVGVALGWLAAAGSGPAALVLVAGAAAPVAIGVAVGRAGEPARRERAWEIEAVGALVLAVAWLWVVAAGD
jgi:4-hydroxybenzoate polyprenyltransferase/geranylgeranylglycerol-phosphate geranylgeranyltransferase